MTAALGGGEWSAAHPGRTLPPGKTRYPLHRRLGGPQDRSGRVVNLVPTGIRSRTVQPAVLHYVDGANSKLAVIKCLYSIKIYVCSYRIFKKKGLWGSGGVQ